MSEDPKIVIIGAGPAGLTAAYELVKVGVPTVVLEKDQVVGGISRTVSYKGYFFDIGGHRFFTKVKRVQEMWSEVLGDEFLHRRRLSRIYYRKKFFYYPLRPFDTLMKLGLIESVWILGSYFHAQIFPIKEEDTFEQWITNRFGKRLFNTFFKTYTEKVWGIPCDEIKAEWAAQRIQGLSLLVAARNALFRLRPDNKYGSKVATLIGHFDYPKLGPGMMWQAVEEIIHKEGSEVCLGTAVKKILWDKDKVEAIEAEHNGRKKIIRGTHFISSMPIQQLIRMLQPAPPEEVQKAAQSLRYRDFLTVAIIVDKADIFPDNWIYVHDPTVRLGRIQNFKNWSPHMVPDQNKTCLGLEYFCFEGDELWSMSDKELIDLGKRELERLELLQECDVEDGFVVRMPKSYPMYQGNYRESLLILRRFFEKLSNFQVVGRNGMHRYNNQDHSMLTSMLAVENIFGAEHDLWDVNVGQEYHEEGHKTSSR